MIAHIAGGILAFIPALVANPFAVVFGGGKPIDGSYTYKGKRILGDGKTWRGLFGGSILGGALGFILNYLLSPWLKLYPHDWSSFLVVFSLSFGALLGDIGGSFIKRRIGKKRGEKLPIIDQYDFVIGSFILTNILAGDWFSKIYFEGGGWVTLLIIIIGVPILHRTVNIVGYKIGLKKEPW
ncbi:MAG: CDP-2,3-bis-(O-geranylgeranyl)-sn-glycerol synthase [Thermoplasmatota archaeon]